MIFINNLNNNYYKTVYCNYWLNQVRIYGKDKYTKSLINILLSKNPQNVFEFAIGTGWPIADSLQKKNIKVNGCDISPKLIKYIKRNHIDWNVYVGDTIKIFECEYDLIYCLRSSWYMRDFFIKLEDMIKHVKRGGYIIFDIMNKDSFYYYQETFYYHPKSILNSILNFAPLPPRLNFYRINNINNFLKSRSIKFKIYSQNQLDASNNKALNLKSTKLIYICKKL